MTLGLTPFEIGTAAEWVSGIGSIAASIVALYLAGSERRARKIAERPHINCKVESVDTDWAELLVSFENPSAKLWRLIAVESRDRRAAVVGNDDLMIEGEYGPTISLDRRAEYAKREIALVRDIMPLGSISPSWESHRPGNKAFARLHYRIPPSARTLRFDLVFQSAEPVPETFRTKVVRAIR